MIVCCCSVPGEAEPWSRWNVSLLLCPRQACSSPIYQHHDNTNMMTLYSIKLQHFLVYRIFHFIIIVWVNSVWSVYVYGLSHMNRAKDPHCSWNRTWKPNCIWIMVKEDFDHLEWGHKTLHVTVAIGPDNFVTLTVGKVPENVKCESWNRAREPF